MSFARAALLPSPRGDLARPVAIHDALRIAGADAELAPAALAIRVRLGPSGGPVFEIGSTPAPLDAIRHAVAAGSGRVLLGAEPDVPMALFTEALDAALAGRLERPSSARPDIEIDAGG